MGSKTLSGGEAFVELGNLITQNPCFFFQDLLGLFGGPTGLLSLVEFVSLSHRARVDLTDPPVTLDEGSFELLDHRPMGRFPIAEFNF